MRIAKRICTAGSCVITFGLEAQLISILLKDSDSVY